MSNILPSEDINIADQYIILNLLIDTLERELKSIEASTIRLQKPYLELTENILSQGRKELIATKQLMRKKGIRVFDKTIRNEDFWDYKYLIRGYEGNFNYLKYALKMKMEKRLLEYFYPAMSK
ncbi:hypothetical protein K7887_22720 (plasmid) [Sutcliffiella horikoshii]|uniref:hypothetical protein n=1 Tax=Sutcliffiella horikoshii TaxID=79883 RepID=UPI001CBB6912|nr:hypothetical protein [Sutcliffiella horikoshii]UAL49783.1 hypothetical protein K7887_22720 [Sutcliffiella horikoshii]